MGLSKMKWAKCPMCKGFGSERIANHLERCRLCSKFKVRGKIPTNIVDKLNQLLKKDSLGDFQDYLRQVISRVK